MAREQLEKDLHSTKTQLQENNPKESHNGETLEKLVSSQQLSSESDVSLHNTNYIRDMSDRLSGVSDFPSPNPLISLSPSLGVTVTQA